MALLSGVMDLLFGSPKSSSEAMSKEDIAWLMDEGLTANRTDKQGLFGGWDWTQGDDGRWTQTENVNPALMPGIEKLMGSISGDQKPYESPQQFGKLLDAMMGNKMTQYGMDPSGYAPSGQPQQPQQRMPYTPPVKPPEQPPGGVGGFGQFDPRLMPRNP